MNATVDNPEVKNVVYSIVESMVDRELRMNPLLVPEGNLDTTTALIYDSVNAFAIALHQLTSVQQVDRQKHSTSSCLIKRQNVDFPGGIVIIVGMLLLTGLPEHAGLLRGADLGARQLPDELHEDGGVRGADGPHQVRHLGAADPVRAGTVLYCTVLYCTVLYRT